MLSKTYASICSNHIVIFFSINFFHLIDFFQDVHLVADWKSPRLSLNPDHREDELHQGKSLLLYLAIAKILADCLRREAKDLIYPGIDFFCYLFHDFVPTQWSALFNAKSGIVFK